MDDQERYERFRSALGFRADVAELDQGALELAALDGEPLDPRVHLHVDACSLADHVGDALGDDVDEHVASRVATLLAQLEEAILVRGPGEDHLVLAGHGVRAVRAEELSGTG